MTEDEPEMAGRPPKPTEVKRDQGTLRPDRERGKVPEPPPLAAAPPAPKALNIEEKAIWDQYALVLVTRRILTDGDLLLLELLAREWIRYLELAQDLAEEGVSIDTATGPKRNPKAIEMNAAVKNVMMTLREFGLTPSGRVRVRGAAAPGEEEDPLAKFRMIPGGKGT